MTGVHAIVCITFVNDFLHMSDYFLPKNHLNLPTAFWGLLGPQKDVTVDSI